MMDMDGAIGIIGGADGPTAIIVSGNVTELIVAAFVAAGVAIAAVAAIVMLLRRKKRRKGKDSMEE